LERPVYRAVQLGYDNVKVAGRSQRVRDFRQGSRGVRVGTIETKIDRPLNADSHRVG
jgi:hypothetical protein